MLFIRNTGRGAALGAAALLGLTLGAGGAVRAQDYTLKLAHVGSTADEDHHAALYLKEFLETNSQGRIEVEIYPGGQLGNFRQLLEQVQLGTIEATLTTVGGAANMFPEIQVSDIPYMFPNDRVAEKVYDGPFTDRLRDAVLEETGTVRLMAVTNTGGWRNFLTTGREIKTPEDLGGAKIRTIESPLQVQLVEIMGGNATPIPWQEVYTSLATGVVEGTKNGITDIVNMKFQDFLRYIVLDGHAYMGGFWWMNDDWLRSLPEDLQGLVVDGFDHMKGIGRAFPKRYSIDAYEEFRDAGGTVYAPTPEEKEAFKEAAKPVREWFIDEFGPEWVEALEGAIAEAEAEVAAERQEVLN